MCKWFCFTFQTFLNPKKLKNLNLYMNPSITLVILLRRACQVVLFLFLSYNWIFFILIQNLAIHHPLVMDIWFYQMLLYILCYTVDLNVVKSNRVFFYRYIYMIERVVFQFLSVSSWVVRHCQKSYGMEVWSCCLCFYPIRQHPNVPTSQTSHIGTFSLFPSPYFLTVSPFFFYVLSRVFWIRYLVQRLAHTWHSSQPSNHLLSCSSSRMGNDWIRKKEKRRVYVGVCDPEDWPSPHYRNSFNWKSLSDPSQFFGTLFILRDWRFRFNLRISSLDLSFVFIELEF